MFKGLLLLIIVQLPDHLCFGGHKLLNMEYELMLVNLKNSAGVVKVAALGFSWKTFFFGPLVPLFRGDFKGLLLMLLTDICTVGLFYLIWPFIYNKVYTKSLLNRGFGPAGDDSKSTLISYGISVM